jgi:hypothetical protein
MLTEDDLIDMLKTLTQETPCEEHGKDRMEICGECQTVLCMVCRPFGCQCWNDE